MAERVAERRRRRRYDALTLSSNGSYGGETGWSGSGGGYSKFEPKPSYQQGVQGSIMRTHSRCGLQRRSQYRRLRLRQLRLNERLQLVERRRHQCRHAAIRRPDRGYARPRSWPSNHRGSLSNVDPLLYALPAGDFHDETTGNNTYATKAGYDLVTGRGSHVADKLVKDLVGQATASTSTTTTTTQSSVTSKMVATILLGGQTYLSPRASGAGSNTPTPQTAMNTDGFWNRPSLMEATAHDEMLRDLATSLLHHGSRISASDEEVWDFAFATANSD